jgi:hypothetical protein
MHAAWEVSAYAQQTAGSAQNKDCARLDRRRCNSQLFDAKIRRECLTSIFLNHPGFWPLSVNLSLLPRLELRASMSSTCQLGQSRDDKLTVPAELW